MLNDRDKQKLAAVTDKLKGNHRKWITEFARDIDQTFETVIAAAEQFLSTGDYTYDNSESYKDHWDKFPEFWVHYEALFGVQVEDEKKESFFTCSC